MDKISDLKKIVIEKLDSNKALDIVSIDLSNKTSIADYIDGIDLIVHIFNPEKRKFYEIEKIWSELIPKEKVII